MDSLIPAGRRRRGPLEAALERALGALAREESRGAGAQLADLRRAMRDAALAVDTARRNVLEHGANPYTLSVAVRTYLEVRTAVLPLEAPGDNLDRAFRELLALESGGGPAAGDPPRP
jgi:hypothetical protein